MSEASDLIDKRAPLTGARVFARLAVIGAVLLAVAGAFAYTGGWLSADRLTQADLARAVFGIGYAFDGRTEFNSEFEVEHAIASSTVMMRAKIANSSSSSRS